METNSCRSQPFYESKTGSQLTWVGLASAETWSGVEVEHIALEWAAVAE